MSRFYPKWEVNVRMRAIEYNSHVAGMQVKCHACGTTLHTCDDDCFHVPSELQVKVMDDTRDPGPSFAIAPYCEQGLLDDSRDGTPDPGQQPSTSRRTGKKRGCRGGGKKRNASAARDPAEDTRLFFSPDMQDPMCMACVRKLNINTSVGLKCRSPVHPLFMREYCYLKSLRIKELPCKYAENCSVATCGYLHPLSATSTTTIDCLDEVALECVLSYIDNVDLLMTVGSVCTRWRDLAVSIYKRKRKTPLYTLESTSLLVPACGFPVFPTSYENQLPPPTSMHLRQHAAMEKALNKRRLGLLHILSDGEVLWVQGNCRNFATKDRVIRRQILDALTVILDHYEALARLKYSVGNLPALFPVKKKQKLSP